MNFDLSNCTLCPRNCGVNRIANQVGFCKEPASIFGARGALHMWEEPCISGMNGSGAVFFSGCNLGCVFCQNYQIANATVGLEISTSKLADIFLSLEDQGAHNINLVTGSHYVPQIIRSLEQAKNRGLSIPIVYNTSSYEKVETLKCLDGLIDIYLPDLKYKSGELSQKYSHAKDYFEYATMAIAEMYRQVGEPVFTQTQLSNSSDNNSSQSFKSHSSDDDNDISETSLLKRGMIVRHLVLPGNVSDSLQVIDYLNKTYGDSIYISVMNQYTPMPQIGDYPELNRRLTRYEYEKVIRHCILLGMNHVFIQDRSVAKESFIPVFDYEGLTP